MCGFGEEFSGKALSFGIKGSHFQFSKISLCSYTNGFTYCISLVNVAALGETFTKLSLL